MNINTNKRNFGVLKYKHYELLYIAGPITNINIRNQNLNVERGKQYAMKWFQNGFAVYCPHIQTGGFDNDMLEKYNFGDFIDRDLAILRKCDGVVFIPGWRYSRGTLIEHMFASKEGIPVIYDDEQTVGIVSGYPHTGDIVYLPDNNSHNTGKMTIVTNVCYPYIKTDIDSTNWWRWDTELQPFQKDLYKKHAGVWGYPF